VSVIVYDAGMLIGLLEQERRAHVLHKGLLAAGGHRPIVPGPTLSQVWRTSPKTAYAWSRILKDVFVYPGPRSARPGELPPSCLPCASGIDTEGWRIIGDMIGDAALPGKKKPDPVDALAVYIAVRHGGGKVLTSDPEDIAAYAATVPLGGVETVTV
jgi:hypothetical protein